MAGIINVSQALTVSSDVFFYNLGVRFWDARATYGNDAIQKWANELGYGEETGIDLPDETPNARVDSESVVDREHAQFPKDYPNAGWFTGNNLELAFGQGGTVITPIEQAVAYATFANGGTRYVPELAAGMVAPSTGEVVESVTPKVTGHVAFTAADHQAMLEGFEGAIQDKSGTAYGAFTGFPLSTFPLAGKTGTATTNEQQPTSWFVGWGPEADPQYLIAVVVEGGGYGASAAAPVARQGFDYLVAHPESPAVLAVPKTPSTSSSPSSTTTTTVVAPGAGPTAG